MVPSHSRAPSVAFASVAISAYARFHAWRLPRRAPPKCSPESVLASHPWLPCGFPSGGDLRLNLGRVECQSLRVYACQVLAEVASNVSLVFSAVNRLSLAPLSAA